MISFQNLIIKLKKLSGLKTDKAVAIEILGLKADAFVQRKKRNAIPYENVINYCLVNKISLDSLFENNEIIIREIEDVETKRIETPTFSLSKISIIDSNEFVILPFNSNDRIVKAFVDNSNKSIFISNISINNFSEDGNYLIKYNDRIFVKKIMMNFNDTYKIMTIYSDESERDFTTEVTEDELLKIEILGKVIEIFKAS